METGGTYNKNINDAIRRDIEHPLFSGLPVRMCTLYQVGFGAQVEFFLRVGMVYGPGMSIGLPDGVKALQL